MSRRYSLNWSQAWTFTRRGGVLMKTSLLLAVTNALILGCLWVPSARADKPAEPWSYRVVCPNGKFVFVMIATAFANERPEDWGEDRAKEIREIRARYTQSGLYRNDGSNDPLWTVDWYSFHVYVAS